MFYYRLYYFNDNNRIFDFKETECDGDQAAMLFAHERRNGRAMELWNKERLVLRLEAGAQGAIQPRPEMSGDRPL